MSRDRGNDTYNGSFRYADRNRLGLDDVRGSSRDRSSRDRDRSSRDRDRDRDRSSRDRDRGSRDRGSRDRDRDRDRDHDRSHRDRDRDRGYINVKYRRHGDTHGDFRPDFRTEGRHSSTDEKKKEHRHAYRNNDSYTRRSSERDRRDRNYEDKCKKLKEGKKWTAVNEALKRKTPVNDADKVIGAYDQLFRNTQWFSGTGVKSQHEESTDSNSQNINSVSEEKWWEDSDSSQKNLEGNAEGDGEENKWWEKPSDPDNTNIKVSIPDEKDCEENIAKSISNTESVAISNPNIPIVSASLTKKEETIDESTNERQNLQSPNILATNEVPDHLNNVRVRKPQDAVESQAVVIKPSLAPDATTDIPLQKWSVNQVALFIDLELGLSQYTQVRECCMTSTFSPFVTDSIFLYKYYCFVNCCFDVIRLFVNSKLMDTVWISWIKTF